MAKELQRNVKVGDTWYGPAWPDNKVTAEVLSELEGNDLAFAPVAPADAVGTVFGPKVATDGDSPAADPGTSLTPLTEADRARLDDMSKDDLLALADARDIQVARASTKAEIIDRLTGK